MKIPPVEARFYHADGRTDMKEIIVASRSFPEALQIIVASRSFPDALQIIVASRSFPDALQMRIVVNSYKIYGLKQSLAGGGRTRSGGYRAAVAPYRILRNTDFLTRGYQTEIADGQYIRIFKN